MVVLLMPIPIVVPLGPKYHMLGKLSASVQCSDAFDNILGIHRYGFASNFNVLAVEGWTAR